MPDQRVVLSWNDILSGSTNTTLDLNHLRFVIDETEEDKIQFAIYPYREGKVVLFSPTSALPVINPIAIFNIASTLVKAIAKRDVQRDKLVLEMTHIEIFEDNFVKQVVSFSNNICKEVIADSVTNIPILEYHCKCNTPGGEYNRINYFDFWDGAKQALECDNNLCKERYHKDCLANGNSIDDSVLTWYCPPCSLGNLIGQAKHWGTGVISNTCTIDGLHSGTKLLII